MAAIVKNVRIGTRVMIGFTVALLFVIVLTVMVNSYDECPA